MVGQNMDCPEGFIRYSAPSYRWETKAMLNSTVTVSQTDNKGAKEGATVFRNEC